MIPPIFLDRLAGRKHWNTIRFTAANKLIIRVRDEQSIFQLRLDHVILRVGFRCDVTVILAIGLNDCEHSNSPKGKGMVSGPAY